METFSQESFPAHVLQKRVVVCKIVSLQEDNVGLVRSSVEPLEVDLGSVLLVLNSVVAWLVDEHSVHVVGVAVNAEMPPISISSVDGVVDLEDSVLACLWALDICSYGEF